MSKPEERMRALRWGLELLEAVQRDATIPVGIGEKAALAMQVHSSLMDVSATLPATPEERYELVAREVEAQLGSKVAGTYMHTRNFSLGGLMPAELVATEEGTRQVLTEISAQADGGPL